MRLWSLHPKYLDAAGLVALWREALLARHVLEGRTRGYVAHPQLERFRASRDPVAAIRSYLHAVADEADARGYAFDRARVGGPARRTESLPVALGQARFEWAWILEKTRLRSPKAFRKLRAAQRKAPKVPGGKFVPDPHPAFAWVPGKIAAWERTAVPVPERRA